VLGYANAVQLESSGDVQGTDGPMMPPSRAGINAVGSDSAARLRQRAGDAAMSFRAEAILRSRQTLSPIYQRLLTSGKGAASGLEAEERSIGHRSIRIGTTTDRWPRRYAVALPAQVVLLATIGDSGSPTLHIAYALAASAAAVPIRLRASVLGPGGRMGAVLDTVMSGSPRRAPGGRDQVFGLVPLSMLPGRFTARVGLEAGRAGVVSARDTIEIPSPTSAGIAMSDVVLGARSVPLSWVSTAGDTIWVNPLGQFRASEPMQLHVEVSGALHDSTYRVTLAVKRPGGASLLHRIAGWFGGGGGGMRLTFAERSRDGRDVIHRELSLERLKPATYVLEVTVVAPAGAKVTRRQLFTVVR
ncbi:MAG: hypothetical protein ACRELE_02760, partial [Gemmatimonadales bacterium]